MILLKLKYIVKLMKSEWRYSGLSPVLLQVRYIPVYNILISIYEELLLEDYSKDLNYEQLKSQIDLNTASSIFSPLCILILVIAFFKKIMIFYMLSLFRASTFQNTL